MNQPNGWFKQAYDSLKYMNKFIEGVLLISV